MKVRLSYLILNCLRSVGLMTFVGNLLVEVQRFSLS